jgi:hypothetical protein
LRESYCRQSHDQITLSQRELEHEALLLAVLKQAFPAAAERALREAIVAMQAAAGMTRHVARLKKAKLAGNQDRAEVRAFQYRATACLAALGTGASLKFSARLDAGGGLHVSNVAGAKALPLLVPTGWLTESQLRTRKLIEASTTGKLDPSEGTDSAALP